MSPRTPKHSEPARKQAHRLPDDVPVEELATFLDEEEGVDARDVAAWLETGEGDPWRGSSR